MNNTIIYTINPESNQITTYDPEEVARITGIELEKIQAMQEGDLLTDGTGSGSCPAKFEVVASNKNV